MTTGYYIIMKKVCMIHSFSKAGMWKQSDFPAGFFRVIQLMLNGATHNDNVCQP